MARLPSVTGRRVVRALTGAGFVLDRIIGSHHVMTYPSDAARTVSVPCHSSRNLKPGTFRGIIRQAWPTVDEFND